MYVSHIVSHYIYLIHVKTFSGEEYFSEYEDHGVSDNSEGSSEPPFMLPRRPCLTPAQEKKVWEKYKEIEPGMPFYVAIINKGNVYKPGSRSTPTLVSSRKSIFCSLWSFCIV